MAGILDFLGSPGGGGLLDLLRSNALNQQFSSGLPSDQAQYGQSPLYSPPMQAMAQTQPQQAPVVQAPPMQAPQQPMQQPQMQQAQPVPQMQAPQQPSSETLPTFLSSQGGLGAGLRGVMNNAHTGPIGALIGGIGSAMGMQNPAQQNLKAEYDALLPMLGPQKAMLAVMNKEAGKTLINEALTNREKFQQTGEDAFGTKQYGFVNDRDQTVNGKPIGQSDNGGVGGFLASGVKQMDSTLTGGDYLKQFSPEVQAAVQNYIDGKSTPTGNPRKGFTQAVKMIAQKVGADTGQQVDDTTFAARKQMRNQLSSSAPSSLGGQINIGNTAAGHLADLTQRALDLGNVDIGLAGPSHLINEVRGMSSDQSAKMEALKGAAQHYGQEITKFYAGSPGGVAERDRFIESVHGAKTPKELAAVLSTEGELMRSRLDALGGQIKGVLGDEGTKQYPVLRPDGQTALAKVEENVSKLKGGQAAAAKPAPDRSAVEAEMRRRGLLK